MLPEQSGYSIYGLLPYCLNGTSPRSSLLLSCRPFPSLTFFPSSLTGLILLSIPSILLHFVHGYIELFFLRFSPVLFTSPITTMDKYEVEKKLDEVDKVYLVRDRKTDALYVRKKIYATRFQESEEMEILKELCSNPHVIQLIDDFPVPGCGSLHYVVMEYADGGDLGKAIEERKEEGLDSYSETDALFIVCSIALVLYDLYDCNVHHGDIKPTNVFLMSSGRVKVGDFGASKKLENASEERSAFRGTTSYCSPEIDGLGNGGTHKSDVFSLGIILYELLTLKHPFQVNGNIVEQKKRGYNGGYDVPPLPQSCSQTVKDLVQSMLENDPAKRIHIKDLMLLPFLQPYFRWIHAEAQKEDQQTELEELKKRFEATLEEENKRCKAALEEKDQVIASKEEDLLAATVVISDLEHEVQQSNSEKIWDMKCKIGAVEKNLKSQYNNPDRAVIEILDDDLQKPCNDAEEQAEAHLRATILAVKERLTPLLTPPLRARIAADDVEGVRRLVRMGADVMATAKNDTLPLLYFALLKTNMSVVVALLETPAPLDLTRSYPFSSREGAEKATFLDLVCKMPRSEVKPVVEAVITRLLRQKESGTPDTFTWAAPCKEIGGDDFISWLAKQGVLFDVWERLLESDISLVREGGYTISALNMCDADKKVCLWVEPIITVDRGKARAQPLAVVYFQRVWMTLRLLNNRRIHRSRPLHPARVQGNTVHCVSPVPFRIAGPSFLQALRHEVVFWCLLNSPYSAVQLFWWKIVLCKMQLFRNAKGEVSLFKLSLAGTVVVEALDLYLLWRNYRKARATSEISPDLKKEMSDKELDESKRYTVDSLRVSLFSSGVNMVSTIALKALKASPYIHGAIGRRLLWAPCGSFRHAWILSIIEELLTTTISLPMSYYDTFVVEERHGFNKMTRRLFVLDCIKAFASLMVGVASMYILPSFIMPLFNTYSPLDSASNLYKKLEVLCEKTRFPLKQILTVDSSLRSGHSTAYVMGFMGIQQIVIYDTLISQASEDEMVAIISHELGHWSHMHVLQQLIVGTVEITLIAYGARAFIFNHKLVEDFGYASSDPFIGFSVFTDLLGAFSPLIQFLHVAMTRRCERQADCYAVRLGYGPPLRSGLVAVSKSNKGILESDWLFAAAKVSHPELPERLRRIAAEERILAAKGVTIDAHCITPAHLGHIRSLFHLYEGTYCYHNFTPGGRSTDASCHRFMRSITVSDPIIWRPDDPLLEAAIEQWCPSRFYAPDEGVVEAYDDAMRAVHTAAAGAAGATPSASPSAGGSSSLTPEEEAVLRERLRQHIRTVYPDGMEVVRIELDGQSFMLNQIRKMIGAVVCMSAAGLAAEFLTQSLLRKGVHLPVPMVPANGLLLSYMDFSGYGKRLDRIQQNVKFSFITGVCIGRRGGIPRSHVSSISLLCSPIYILRFLGISSSLFLFYRSLSLSSPLSEGNMPGEAVPPSWSSFVPIVEDVEATRRPHGTPGGGASHLSPVQRDALLLHARTTDVWCRRCWFPSRARLEAMRHVHGQQCGEHSGTTPPELFDADEKERATHHACISQLLYVGGSDPAIRPSPPSCPPSLSADAVSKRFKREDADKTTTTDDTGATTTSFSPQPSSPRSLHAPAHTLAEMPSILRYECAHSALALSLIGAELLYSLSPRSPSYGAALDVSTNARVSDQQPSHQALQRLYHACSYLSQRLALVEGAGNKRQQPIKALWEDRRHGVDECTLQTTSYSATPSPSMRSGVLLPADVLSMDPFAFRCRVQLLWDVAAALSLCSDVEEQGGVGAHHSVTLHKMESKGGGHATPMGLRHLSNRVEALASALRLKPHSASPAPAEFIITHLLGYVVAATASCPCASSSLLHRTSESSPARSAPSLTATAVAAAATLRLRVLVELCAIRIARTPRCTFLWRSLLNLLLSLSFAVSPTFAHPNPSSSSSALRRCADYIHTVLLPYLHLRDRNIESLRQSSSSSPMAASAPGPGGVNSSSAPTQQRHRCAHERISQLVSQFPYGLLQDIHTFGGCALQGEGDQQQREAAAQWIVKALLVACAAGPASENMFNGRNWWQSTEVVGVWERGLTPPSSSASAAPPPALFILRDTEDGLEGESAESNPLPNHLFHTQLSRESMLTHFVLRFFLSDPKAAFDGTRFSAASDGATEKEIPTEKENPTFLFAPPRERHQLLEE
eukprot:gene6375-4600_t